MAKKNMAAKASLQATESTGRGKQRKAEELAAEPKAAGNKKQKKAVQQQQPQQRQEAETGEQPSTGGGAAASTGKKGGSEIDELFGQLRRKQESQPATERGGEEQQRQQDKREASGRTEAVAAAPRIAGSKDDIFGTEAGKARKRTEEGYVIYSEEELGMHRKDAGNTPLCPFDCDCCY